MWYNVFTGKTLARKVKAKVVKKVIAATDLGTGKTCYASPKTGLMTHRIEDALDITNVSEGVMEMRLFRMRRKAIWNNWGDIRVEEVTP